MSNEISDRDFKALSGLVYEKTGIALSDGKKSLLTSRLQKRLRQHGLATYAEYLELVKGDGDELEQFINAITTNKTEFFREAVQFDDLRTRLVPALVASGRRKYRLWCAAASTGEEPWTIAMTLFDALPNAHSADVRILATDIDTAVLARAREGFYDDEHVGGLSRAQLERHFDRQDGGWSVKPHLRRWIDFRQLNLVAETWPHAAVFDAIYCRNVMIYFDHQTRDRLVRRFARHVAPDGQLYLGLSEAVHWMPEVWKSIGPSTYVHAQGAEQVAAPRVVPRPPAAAPALAAPAKKPRVGSMHAPPGTEALPRTRIIVGQVEARSEPAVISTLLGSCVAIGLTDPVAGVGGLNHFLLPETTDVDPSRAASYGAFAIELLINAVLKAGGQKKRLEAKIFGGGRVLQNLGPERNIGANNLKFAQAFLEKDGIRVVSVRPGGDGGLDVNYVTATGQAFVRPIPITQLTGTEKLEREARQKVIAPAEAAGGDVELF